MLNIASNVIWELGSWKLKIGHEGIASDLRIYYILLSNAINKLVSMSRQLESHSLGVEIAEAYSKPC